MFRVIDHTADIGLLIKGKNKEELFAEAARGMFSIIAGGRLNPHLPPLSHPPDGSPSLRGRIEKGGIRIEVEGLTLEELLVAFLSELLYLAEKEKAIFNRFKVEIKKMKNGFYLQGRIRKNSQIPKREVKAATYHNLKVEKKGNFWQTTIILDV
ncbi:hypothetical protein GH153_05115 [bacterium]|nr:hypothetical protein [bacterium]